MIRNDAPEVTFYSSQFFREMPLFASLFGLILGEETSIKKGALSGGKTRKNEKQGGFLGLPTEQKWSRVKIIRHNLPISFHFNSRLPQT